METFNKRVDVFVCQFDSVILRISPHVHRRLMIRTFVNTRRQAFSVVYIHVECIPSILDLIQLVS